MKKRQPIFCFIMFLLFIGVASSMFAFSDTVNAKSLPNLSQTNINLMVGKSTKIKVKNIKSKKVRTVWKFANKKSKKIVKFISKTKTSVTIKAKKVGKATLNATIKLGTKKYVKRARIVVKPKKEATTTKQKEENKNTNTQASVTDKTEPNINDNTIIPCTQIKPKYNVVMNHPSDFFYTNIEYILVPENTTQRDIIWTSSNEDILTVDDNGKITSKERWRAGLVTVTATLKDNPLIKTEFLINVFKRDFNS